ncbi:MAG: TonB-dependent receptor [Deltaproteobacteria bacterium]|nr:TonB-dependent receptor [Deltaproteobacteria bacterium]
MRDSVLGRRRGATSARPCATSLVPLALALALIAGPPPAASRAADARGDGGAGGTEVARGDEVVGGADVARGDEVVGGADVTPGDEVVGGTDVTGDAPMSRLDPLVVTATRTQTALSNLPQTVTVVSREDIEESEVDTVGDLLRAVTGVTVQQSGGRGTSTSVFIRGSASDEVLTLIDGVQVNSVTLGAFDFANLTPEGFDRVEVLRGGGGSLYGSEAIGGVVNLITRRGDGPPSGSMSFAGGNGGTDRETGAFSAATERFRIAGSATHIGTAGFGPEIPVDEGGTAQKTNQDYDATTASLRADWTPTETAALYGIVHYVGSSVGLANASNFLGVLDPNARQKGDFYFAKLGWEDAPLDGLSYRLSGAYVLDDQRFDDPPDVSNAAETRSRIPSEIVQGDAQANYVWQWSLSTVGFQYTRKAADVTSYFSFGEPPDQTFAPSREDYGVYGQEQVRLFDDHLILLGSVRYDHDTQFGSVTSPTAAIAGRLPWQPWPGYWTGTRLRATYAQGFRAPTFNELFFPGFGNPDLEPERSSEWNTGFDVELLDGRAVLYATYFDRRVTDDIVTVLVDPETFAFAPLNLGRVDATGVETGIDVDLGAGFRFGGTYTYLGLESGGGTDGVVRRPNNQMSSFLAYRTPQVFSDADAFQARVDVFFVGDRPDFDPETGDVVTNPQYTRVDLATAYVLPWRLFDTSFSLFGQVSNLLDRDYEEVLGFPALPINALAGLRIALG